FAPLPLPGPHTESDPSWSPDSKTLAFLSTAGEKDQSQLWIQSAGAAPKKWTRLKGYAGRPRWSPDGKKIAFLYIEGGGGGGPLYAAPVQTGVIDQEIRNQRIAVVEDRKSTRLNSSHVASSYAVFCLKKHKRPLPTSNAAPSFCRSLAQSHAT